MSRYLLNLFNAVLGAVEKVGWVEVIDVLIVAVILYQLLKLVRGTRAAELIVGLVLLSLVGVIASTLKLILLGWLFTNAAPFVVIALIAPVSKACMRALLSFGSAIARMIRMMAITINSSMSEKPPTRRYLRFSTHSPPQHCMTNMCGGACKECDDSL